MNTQLSIPKLLFTVAISLSFLINSGHTAEHTFQVGHSKYVQLTLPAGWSYSPVAMGLTPILVYYGAPGLSMMEVAQQGLDAIRVNINTSHISVFSETDKEQFFRVENITGLKNTLRLAEYDNMLAVIAELNLMHRISGTRLVDGHKVNADAYIRGGMLDGENPDDYLGNRYSDYMAILYFARVFVNSNDIQGRPIIQIGKASGWNSFERVLRFLYNNRKPIGFGVFSFVIGIVLLKRRTTKQRAAKQ